MIFREKVSPAELFLVLDREFHSGSRTCLACATPMPVPDTGPGHAGGWRLVTNGACSDGCTELLAAITERLQARYELAPR